MQKHSRRNRKGLTLIELMLVLVILVILASSVGFFVGNAQKNALKDSARAQIGRLETCVSGYQVDVRRLPANLSDLVAAPANLPNPSRWRGPYIKGNLPKDPWDNDYQFSVDPQNNNFTILSFGPNGIQGGGDDITSTDQS